MQLLIQLPKDGINENIDSIFRLSAQLFVEEQSLMGSYYIREVIYEEVDEWLRGKCTFLIHKFRTL